MKTLILIPLILLATGCTSASSYRMFDSGDSGFVMLSGDAEGIRAYNDGLIGLVTETKNHPENKSSYWQSREKETEVRVLKFRPVQKK